jgi:hypothetical protein
MQSLVEFKKKNNIQIFEHNDILHYIFDFIPALSILSLKEINTTCKSVIEDKEIIIKMLWSEDYCREKMFRVKTIDKAINIITNSAKIQKKKFHFVQFSVKQVNTLMLTIEQIGIKKPHIILQSCYPDLDQKLHINNYFDSICIDLIYTNFSLVYDAKTISKCNFGCLKHVDFNEFVETHYEILTKNNMENLIALEQKLAWVHFVINEELEYEKTVSIISILKNKINMFYGTCEDILRFEEILKNVLCLNLTVAWDKETETEKKFNNKLNILLQKLSVKQIDIYES